MKANGRRISGVELAIELLGQGIANAGTALAEPLLSPIRVAAPLPEAAIDGRCRNSPNAVGFQGTHPSAGGLLRPTLMRDKGVKLREGII
jgi:hypothetical protein